MKLSTFNKICNGEKIKTLEVGDEVTYKGKKWVVNYIVKGGFSLKRGDLITFANPSKLKFVKRG